MSRKSQVAVGVVLAAIALVAFSAAPAFADVGVSLGISPITAKYGAEFVITPSITGTDTIPGDAITLEALQPDGITWSTYGEGLTVEDTDTVDPQFIIVDSSFLPWYGPAGWTPIEFRATYKPKSRGVSDDASKTPWPAPPAVVSNTASFQIVKVASAPKVSISAPKSVKHGKYFTIAAQVGPNLGEGNVRIKITRKGAKTPVMNFVVQSDDSGYVEEARRISKRATYKIEVTFLGNQFGRSSKTWSKALIVK